jgi:uncharacterized protein
LLTFRGKNITTATPLPMKNIILTILSALSITVLAIKPEREYKWTPEMRGLKYAEYQVQTPDKYSINVWEYGLPDSVKADKTVIFVGSDAGNMAYMFWQAKAFTEKGIRVISFDYRGFGTSSDFEINKDFLFYREFALDLDSVIKATRAKYSNDKIGLYAMSMGTHISLLRNEKIDFLIADGFYHNPQKVVERIKVNKDRTILLPANTKSIYKIKGKTPVLIFCADKDKTTMTEDAKQFSKKNNVTLIEYSGEHLNGFGVMTKTEPGDEYMKTIMDFLRQNKV